METGFQSCTIYQPLNWGSTVSASVQIMFSDRGASNFQSAILKVRLQIRLFRISGHLKSVGECSKASNNDL